MIVAFGEVCSQADSEVELHRFQFQQTHMGAPVKITLYASDERSANQAAEAAFARFAQLDQIMSDYKPDSELSRLSGTAGSGQAVEVSDDLWNVLNRSRQVSEASEGAFDITVGPYVRLWRRARRSKEFPPEQRLAEARRAVGHQHLRLDGQRHTAQLLAPGMRLDLGGIAAGYAVDEALAVLAANGVKRALIDASGDIGAGDAPPGEQGWKIGIAPLDPAGPPSRYVVLCNAAVTTSGDAFQHVVIGGRRYSHIVDPRTGLGLTEPSSVCVVAADCITADSLATAVSVMGPRRGLDLIERTPRAAALIVREVNSRVETHTSKRLSEYELDKRD
ncbi:MAG TPA: FAD:protein FMN transferase [Pirellulales bacterium]|nr:FAD:protein FMN transferase [Pirellulales bacterium]